MKDYLSTLQHTYILYPTNALHDLRSEQDETENVSPCITEFSQIIPRYFTK